MQRFVAVLAQLLSVLCIAVLALAPVVLSGCGKRDENPVALSSGDENGPLQPSVDRSYPQYSFFLNVPWMAQVPPGTWAGTKNCGQACGVMLGGYYNKGAVAPWVITAENQLLYNLTGESQYLQPNGWYTGGTRLWAFREMLRRFHGLQTAAYNGNRADDVVNEVARGRPVIVGVMIKDGRIVPSGGVPHWALAVGWDGRIILHDPGSSGGAFRPLTVAEFEATWATQQKIYIPVWK